MLADLAQGESPTVAQPPGAGAQGGVDEAARQEGASCRVQGARTALAQGGRLDAPEQLAQDVGVRARVRGRLDHPLPPAHVVAHAHRGEDEIELLALQRCRGRQDDVGVTRGLVDVVVDGHAEVE